MSAKKIRVLICGDRNWKDRELIQAIIAALDVEVIIEGEARGADTLAREVAQEYNIPVLAFPAEWSKYGRAAGPIRNKQMLDEGRPDLVVAFHNNITASKGTKDMLQRARDRGIDTRLHRGRR